MSDKPFSHLVTFDMQLLLLEIFIPPVFHILQFRCHSSERLPVANISEIAHTHSSEIEFGFLQDQPSAHLTIHLSN